jgi:hypothetical protein
MTSKNFCCNFGRALVATSLVFVLLAPSTLSAQKPFGIQARWTIGGEGGWDYLAVDEPMHRL